MKKTDTELKELLLNNYGIVVRGWGPEEGEATLPSVTQNPTENYLQLLPYEVKK